MPLVEARIDTHRPKRPADHRSDRIEPKQSATSPTNHARSPPSPAARTARTYRARAAVHGSRIVRPVRRIPRAVREHRRPERPLHGGHRGEHCRRVPPAVGAPEPHQGAVSTSRLGDTLDGQGLRTRLSVAGHLGGRRSGSTCHGGRSSAIATAAKEARRRCRVFYLSAPMRTIGRSRRGPSPGAIARPGATGVPGHPRPIAAHLPIYDGAVLDDRDLDIVAALQADARATYADVAGRVGLSASAVHDRVRKLEQHGVIRGYTAVVDPESLGLFVTALSPPHRSIRDSPTTSPIGSPSSPRSRTAIRVAGEMNYVLKVRTGTTAELEDLIRRLREKAGVATRTTIALSIPFEGRPLHTRARAEGRDQDGR